MSFRLRRAGIADADTLGQVHVAAWREAYQGIIPDEVLSGLDARQRAATWRNALARGGAVWLAEQRRAVVGFASGGMQRDASLPQSGEI